MKRGGFDWVGLILPVIMIGAAEVAVAASGYEGYSLARPSEIVIAWVEALLDGSMLLATAQTLFMASAGLAIGTSIGIVLGAVLGLSPAWQSVTQLAIEILRPIPAVALIPVAMLALGLGYWMEVALVAFTTIWPVLLLTMSAVRGVKRRMLDVGRLLDMSFADRLFKIVIRAAMPGIFVGFRLALGVSLIIAVTIEITTNPVGTGRAMMQAQESLQPALMLAYLMWIGIIGWTLNFAVLRVQRRWFQLRPAVRT